MTKAQRRTMLEQLMRMEMNLITAKTEARATAMSKVIETNLNEAHAELNAMFVRLVNKGEVK